MILEELKKVLLIEDTLNESSLSRLWQKSKDFDCGIITAWRSARKCGTGEVYTKAENIARNKLLLAKLLRAFGDVTRVIGSYIENYGSPEAKKAETETSFFVCDRNGKGNLKEVLQQLGEDFEQDSIAFVPKGETAILIGTNHCPDAWPGYGQINKFDKTQYGKSAEFMTKVKGRPFIYESVEIVNLPQNILGKLSLKKMSECIDIEKFVIDEIRGVHE